MENNKAYLKNIHWALLITIVALSFKSVSLNLIPSSMSVLLEDVVFSIAFYSSLHLIILPPLMITLVALLLRISIFIVLTNLDVQTVPVLPWLFIIGHLIPLTFFIGSLTKWPRQIPLIILSLCFTESIIGNGLHASSGLLSFFDDFSQNTWVKGISFVFFNSAAVLLYLIVIAELVNLGMKKDRISSMRLLNLGNSTSKSSAIITFWALKTAFWSIILGGMNYAFSFNSFNYVPGASYSFLKFVILVHMLGLVAISVFTSWYLRKHLLEQFIAYGRGSRFLYWFCMLPVLGSIVFAVLLTESGKSGNFSSRVRSLEEITWTSSTGVTIVISIYIAARFVFFILTEAHSLAFAMIIISATLFFATVAGYTGYLVNVWVNIIALAMMFLLSLVPGSSHDMLAIFVILSFNLANVLLHCPVYHLDQFLYIPAEDPNPEHKTDLF